MQLGMGEKIILVIFAFIVLILAWHTFRHFAGVPPLPEPLREAVEKLIGVHEEERKPIGQPPLPQPKPPEPPAQPVQPVPAPAPQP